MSTRRANCPAQWRSLSRIPNRDPGSLHFVCYLIREGVFPVTFHLKCSSSISVSGILEAKRKKGERARGGGCYIQIFNFHNNPVFTVCNLMVSEQGSDFILIISLWKFQGNIRDDDPSRKRSILKSFSMKDFNICAHLGKRRSVMGRMRAEWKRERETSS